MLFATTCVAPLRAHHFFAPEYERSLRTELVGRVIEVAYISPHASVELLVLGGPHDGETWFANSVSRNSLPRHAWHAETIQPGDIVTVEGFIGSNGSQRIWIQRIDLPSGAEIYPVGRERTAGESD